MTLKIALCDDDPVYTDSLKKLLWGYAFSHDIDLSIDEYQEGEQLLDAYNNSGMYNVAFMDIEMPKRNGIEIVSDIRSIDRDLITIFVSNYPEYMYDSFSVHPYQFIQKPVTSESLEKTMNDIISDIGAHEDSYVTVTDNSGDKVTISTDAIYYIEAADARNRDLVIHLNGSETETRGTLAQMEKVLPEDMFVRSSRTSLINLSHILLIKNQTVVFDNKLTVSISLRKVRALTELYTRRIVARKRIK